MAICQDHFPAAVLTDDDVPGKSEAGRIDDLLRIVTHCYGRVMIYNEKNVTPSDYALSVEQDLFILFHVQKELPYMSHNLYTKVALQDISSHMNTVEGREALCELVTKHYKHGMIPEGFKQYARDNSDFSLAWKRRFNNPPPIRKEQYSKPIYLDPNRAFSFSDPAP